MKTLDRELLGLRNFWREYRNAINANEPVHIITHRNNIDRLQKDLKLLLAKSIKAHGADAAGGLTPADISLMREVLQWVVILAVIGTVIYLAYKKYRFKVTRDKDGNITIEGEPR